MVSPPNVGDVIKIRAWHGVVLDVFRGERGNTVLRVQTARNIFRRLNPEFIEFDLAPEMISPATKEDLLHEVERYRQALDEMVNELLQSTADSKPNDQEHCVNELEYQI